MEGIGNMRLVRLGPQVICV